MATENQQARHTFVAAADLSDTTAGTGKLYKAVSQATGNIAATGDASDGILLYAGNSGDHVTYGYKGIMKFTAGTAVTSKSVELTVGTGGYMTVAASGDYVVGKYLYGTNDAIAVTSGSIATGLFDFTAPHLI